MTILSYIDNKLKSLIIKNFDEIQESKFNQINAESKSTSEIAEIKTFMAAIDGKCGALLAHLSMMIATLSIFSTLGQHTKLESIILQIEIIPYVLLAIVCLRCVRISTPQLYNINSNESFLYDMRRELYYRRKLYNTCLDLSIIVTSIFVLTICFQTIF